MIVFSFWPDVDHDQGDRRPAWRWPDTCSSTARSSARGCIMAQGRQNTNYAINLYACHPFFIQGFASMTNGENTAFVPDPHLPRVPRVSRATSATTRTRRSSPTSCTTRPRSLGFGIEAYKHVITPLQDEDIDSHPDAALPAQPEAVLPAAHHRRPELRHRLPARRQPLHGPGPQEAAARAWSAASPGCSPFPRRSAAWTPPSRCGTRAGIFSPCTWTPRSSAPTARRFGYAARKTH